MRTRTRVLRGLRRLVAATQAEDVAARAEAPETPVRTRTRVLRGLRRLVAATQAEDVAARAEAPETPVKTRTRVLRGLRRQTQALARLLSELWASVPKGVLRTPVRAALRALADELQQVAGTLAAKSLIVGNMLRFQ